jgi:hypothetical protein
VAKEFLKNLCLPSGRTLHFRLIFASAVSILSDPVSWRDFVIRCKGCGENIPVPVETLTASWIAARCALCGEHRSYMPTEVFQGRVSFALIRKPWARQGRGRQHLGGMRRAIAREEDERRMQDRLLSTLVIAAAIIAAVRLAREDISTPSPRPIEHSGG